MTTQTRRRTAPNWTEPAVLLRKAHTRTLSVAETARLLGMPRDEVVRVEFRALVKFWQGLRASCGLMDGGGA